MNTLHSLNKDIIDVIKLNWSIHDHSVTHVPHYRHACIYFVCRYSNSYCSRQTEQLPDAHNLCNNE